MKAIYAGGLMLLLAVTNASAASVTFKGTICFKSASAGCASDGWSAGHCTNMSLRPRGIADNGDATYLNMFLDYGAVNHTLASGNPVGTTYRSVTGTWIFSGIYQTSAKMRFTKQTPADLTAAEDVTVLGDIKDFDSPGCNISFKATGQRQ